MPIANHEIYKKMLDSAKTGSYAYPAINVFSLESANAVLEGLAASKSDGIIQVSTGGGEFASGATVKNSAQGAISIAEHVHRLADKYNIFVALHTDHCKEDKIESFLYPLLEESEKRVAKGENSLFQSHMYDGSGVSLIENMNIAKNLLSRCAKSNIILEVEAGVVGGEEDGVNNEGTPSEKLYTTPRDMLFVYDSLKGVGEFMLAATFGNVHGVYKPGNVKLNPKILKAGQDALSDKYGIDKGFYLVFHGGSGSSKDDIEETLSYGVIKMNVDTDTQYAFTRPIADHFFKNYDGVLKLDGEVGNKKVYDPRSYLKLGQKGMADRVIEACKDLQSNGKSIY